MLFPWRAAEQAKQPAKRIERRLLAAIPDVHDLEPDPDCDGDLALLGKRAAFLLLLRPHGDQARQGHHARPDPLRAGEVIAVEKGAGEGSQRGFEQKDHRRNAR
jgi:hypothetical protein